MVTDIIIFQVYLVVSNKNLEIAASIIYSPGDEDDNDDDTLPDTHPVSIKALKTDSFFHSFIHSFITIATAHYSVRRQRRIRGTVLDINIYYMIMENEIIKLCIIFVRVLSTRWKKRNPPCKRFCTALQVIPKIYLGKSPGNTV